MLSRLDVEFELAVEAADDAEPPAFVVLVVTRAIFVGDLSRPCLPSDILPLSLSLSLSLSIKQFFLFFLLVVVVVVALSLENREKNDNRHMNK